ncbi:hypothetical protein DW322_08765 [Rhodococcus rhodnii]|uniref:Uncharacterized protein n=2 Tax=Rhodococcus rhodnii TaxID=38312 RepID=R7WRJ1_9NOCA|nr:hypothetical protein [Rhodococcus rhodnii]EOM77921.1 hypothetical protein Rrhod_0730 [Rhodococcus rhodnii LMG 5362]TXG90298.1 hypothetical protein DW322_08765 [Rhodococcus rhodnii]
MTDIVDQIDALIDEQLDAGEPRTGFDFGDPQFPKCPHCTRDWHGLAITRRMEEMRWRGEVDPDYRYTEDESEILCPGSDFIGPWATAEQLERIRRGIASGFLGSLDGLPWRSYALDVYLQARDEERLRRMGSFFYSEAFADGGIIEGAAELHTARVGEALPVNPDRRGTFVSMGRLVPGDRIAIEIAGRRREAVVVDVVERGGEVEFVTQDPNYSFHAARLARLRDAARLRDSARRATSTLSRFAASLGDDATPDAPELPEFPRPSTPPPMWANDPTRTRRGRTRRSSGRGR